ncbi:MAG: serine hydrolase domain-containing protein, partial [Candidatus Dormibacteria bacterium]
AAYECWLRFRALAAEVPSLAYGASYQGRAVLSGAFGQADLESGEPADVARTGYRVASITKTFTATLVMQLVEQGKVRLDDLMVTYLPWLVESMGGEGITLRHLLTHSSGMIRDGSGAWSDDDLPDQATVRRDLARHPTFAAPASGFRYSNLAYALLGEIVEKLTGQAYAEAIAKHILEPLDMGHSGTRLTPRLRSTLATGYWSRRPGEQYQAARATEARAFEPAGGLISTVPDLLRYQEAHFPGDRRLLSELGKREMQRSQWQRDSEPHHGYGWMLWQVEGSSLRGHSGGYAGFNTKIGFDPDLGLSVAVLANTLGVLPRVGVDGFFHIVNRIHSLWGQAGAITGGPSRAELARLAGQYRAGWGEWLVIRVHQSLYLVDPTSDFPLREAARLAAVPGTRRFVIADHEDYGYRGEEVSFVTDGRGRAQELLYGPQRYTRADV